jgi:hypothetical protein
MPVPFAKANFGRGKPYVCPACHARLRTGKVNIGIVIAAFVSASFTGKQFGFIAVVCVLVLLVIYEWLTVRVEFEGDA